MIGELLLTKDMLAPPQGGQQFRERSYLGVIHRVDNQRHIAGHIRLFGGKNNRGWRFFRYNRMHDPKYAFHRVWNFVLFAIHHVGEGEHWNPPGWSVSFARFRIQKKYREISINWSPADTFRVKSL